MKTSLDAKQAPGERSIPEHPEQRHSEDLASKRPAAAPLEAESVKEALKVCRRSFQFAGLFTLAINLLMLTPAFYMMNAYDRVLSSGSVYTLAMLTLIMVFLMTSMGGLEWARTQMLIRVSNKFDSLLASRLYDISLKQALYTGGSNTQAQPLQDLNAVRQFLTGTGLFAFFDLPFVPLYLAVMFLFHPLFGWFACFCLVFFFLLAMLNQRLSSAGLAEANKKAGALAADTTKRLRNAEVIYSMGMMPRMMRRWREGQDSMLVDQSNASSSAGAVTAISKTTRLMFQSLILGVGAYLAVNGELTGGSMIVGSILLGRVLAPMDQITNQWKNVIETWVKYKRLNEILQKVSPDVGRMKLPQPAGNLLADQLTVSAPGSRSPIIKNVSFKIESGASLGIIGPSGSGKSTLIRAILGVWPVMGGKMRLDGADIFTWDRSDLGSSIGYLPQDIELFEGTIAENISRFGVIDSEKVVAAAKAAGVHEMILSLSDGYETSLQSQKLSGGQRQRIGLARALYGDPTLVVLDEPNSNLDEAGEAALFKSIRDLKRRGCTLVVVTHRPNLLSEVDALMMLHNGEIKMAGPRDDVLRELSKNRVAAGRSGQQKAESSETSVNEKKESSETKVTQSDGTDLRTPSKKQGGDKGVEK